jgi:protein involved in polysaccharide export with SLBB domain
MRIILVLCLLVTLMSGCASDTTWLDPKGFQLHFAGDTVESTAVTNEASDVSLKPKSISPGMQLTVTIEEDQSLNRAYAVPPNGVVEFVGAGRISVTGLTAEELAKKIKAPLERDYLQKATVAVSIDVAGGAPSVATGGVGGGVVYVIGNVNRPGPLQLPREDVLTVTKVIIGAGGFGTFAKSSAVQLIRYDKSGRKYATRINVARIMARGEFEKDVSVQNGDWVIVPEKMFNF